MLCIEALMRFRSPGCCAVDAVRLLWLLLFFHIVATLAMAGFALHINRRATDFAARQPEMATRESRARANIETESELEALRSTALILLQRSHKDWSVLVSVMKDIQNGVFWLLFLPAGTAVLLGLALLGLGRRKTPAQPSAPANAG